MTLATAASAQPLYAPPAGATQLGLAGAAVAGQPAATALWHNPAQLVGSKGSFVVGLTIHHEQRNLLPLDPDSDDDYGVQLERDAAEPGLSPTVVVSQALWSKRLWAAFGYRQRFRHRSHFMQTLAQFVASAEEQPRHDPVRYLGSELRVTDHELCLAAAAHLFGSRLHFGAAAAVNLMHLGYRRTLWAGFDDDPRPLVSSPAESARHDVDAALQVEGVGLTFRLGVAIVLARWLQLGFSAELPTAPTLDGDLSLTRCDTASPDCHPADFELEARGGSASIELQLPTLLTFGVAIQPLQRLKLFVAGSYSIVSRDPLEATVQNAQLTVTGNETTTYKLSSLPLGIAWRDAFSARAAAELELVRGFLWLRVGWAYHSNAGTPEQPSAVAPGLSQNLLGLGLCVQRGRFGLLVGVSHGFAESLDTAAEATTLVNPLASETATIGAGHYDGQTTSADLELQLAW